MRLLLAALLLVPAATAGVSIQSVAAVDAAVGVPTVTLAAGDMGTATFGASATGASVAVSTLPLLAADDVLRLLGGPTGWSVHAELQSQSGWGGLSEEVAILLSDGSTTLTQVRISALGVLQSAGTPLAFTTGTDVELRVLGQGTGAVVLDLVLDPGPGGVELRYRVQMTVG